MDGVVVIVLGEIMKSILPEMRCIGELEGELLKEILLDEPDERLVPRAHNFFHSVTEPSKRFVEYWGGEH